MVNSSPPQLRQRVACAHHVRQALGYQAQHGVAHVVPVQSVHILEAVQVQEQDDHALGGVAALSVQAAHSLVRPYH